MGILPILPIIDPLPFLTGLTDPDSTPATEFFRQALETDGVALFTDRPQRSAYILITEILENFEPPKPYTSVVVDEVNAELRLPLMKLLDAITDFRELPHIFYKGKYVGGGRDVIMQYEEGELEERLEVEPYMELPKMYPDEEDLRLYPNKPFYQ